MLLKELKGRKDYILDIPNYSTSYKPLEIKYGDRDNILTLPCKLEGLFDSSAFIKCDPLIAIWLDTTQEYPSLKKQLEILVNYYTKTF
jgi:hypothetical protein